MWPLTRLSAVRKVGSWIAKRAGLSGTLLLWLLSGCGGRPTTLPPTPLPTPSVDLYALAYHYAPVIY